MKKILKSEKYLISRTKLNNVEKKLFEKRNKYIKRKGRYYVPVRPRFSGNFNAVDIYVLGCNSIIKTIHTSHLKKF